jgi:hypothetical protein
MRGQVRIDRAKLALLVPRLASEFEGEVVNTVLAIRRVLKASGHDLHDLARVVAGDALKTRNDSKESLADIITLTEHLLMHQGLSDWERNFLQSIRNQARRKYGFKPSEKQQAIIDRLRAQYG